MTDRKASVLTEAATLVGLYLYGFIGSVPYKVPASLLSGNLGAIIAALTAKTTPVDADQFAIADSADSNTGKKLTFANLKATLKTYFDTLYGSGGMTLLGTLTTTSGTEAVLTSIPAGYRSLRCEIVGVSFANTAQFTVQTSSTNGAAYGTAGNIASATVVAAAALNGVVDIFGIGEAATAAKVAGSRLNSGSDVSVGCVAAPSNTAAVVNAIRFTGSGQTFDGGAIRVYGVK